MTDVTHSTNPPIATLLLHRLEQELDEALEPMTKMFDSDEATAAAYDRFDAIVQRIGKVQPTTLGDLRIQAKALQAHYDSTLDAALFDLLLAVEMLPERLWNEKIGPT